MEVTRLFDLLEYRKTTNPDRPVFAAKREGKWEEFTIDDYIEMSTNISYGLLAMGLQPGEKVALISSNRPEWNFLDMGVQQMGGILVPIYPTISEDDYKYILSNAAVKFIFLEGPELLRKIRNILPELPNVQKIYTFKKRDEQTSDFAELVDLGKANPVPERLQGIRNSIKSKDMVTMIYTSGTTGMPKGVMLSHENIIFNFMGVRETPKPYFSRTMSFLPLCHVYERMMNYFYQFAGYETFYAENMGKVADNIAEVKPHLMCSVPRFLEKIYDKIYRKGEKMKGIKKKLFYWTLDLATEYDLDNRSLCYKLKWRIANRLTYRKLMENFGGCLEMIVSGGAGIQPRLASFFTCIGMSIYEGYGLTETSPVIAVSSSAKNGRKIGTAGPPLPGVEVRIDPETKEILCRGKNVMLGYYQAPELTKEVIDADGWFHTSDTGELLPTGQLRITGRTKTMFKTSMGKFVNPEVIEEKFKESPFILEMMVVGEGQKFAAALITPDFDFLRDWQRRHGIHCETREEMIADKQTLERYKRVMAKYNQFFGETEQVKKFKLLSETWSEANGLITPTLKIKRKKVMERYAQEIENLFK